MMENQITYLIGFFPTLKFYLNILLVSAVKLQSANQMSKSNVNKLSSVQLRETSRKSMQGATPSIVCNQHF